MRPVNNDELIRLARAAQPVSELLRIPFLPIKSEIFLHTKYLPNITQTLVITWYATSLVITAFSGTAIEQHSIRRNVKFSADQNSRNPITISTFSVHLGLAHLIRLYISPIFEAL